MLVETKPNNTWGHGFASLPSLSTPVPPSTDATLSGLTLSGVDFGTFASSTESYAASVAYSVSETTVTPTLSDSDARYIVKLGGVTDTDGTTSLSVGSNVITIEVTAEDDFTTKTYTVRVVRASTSEVGNSNTPATGSPTISGTAQVGQTLTVSTTGIADADGLTSVSYTYQWLADDADISGATGSTYTLAAGDLGKAIKVKVSFTDDAGNTESLTSAPTAAVTPPPLTASAREVPASHDGSSTFTFELHFSEEPSLSYVVLRDDAFTVTGGSIIEARRLTQGSNLGWEITVEPSGNGSVTATLPATTNCAATGAVCTIGGKKLSAQVQLEIAGPDSQQESQQNSLATGSPTISGTAQVGQTLAASTTGIADADGLTSVSYSYQWLADDAAISGATGSTYTLVSGDRGKAIKVKVTFTDDEGNAESLTSAVTAAVAARPNTSATGSPTISGTAQVGKTLSASTTGIADADGLTNVSYSYQWLADDAAISGATSSTYTLVSGDRGKAIKVKVSFTDDGGNAESLTSAPTAAATAANTSATGLPTISGTAQVGKTLTASTTGIADADGITNVSYSYQWLADDAAISGATSSSYTLVASDRGKAIKVKVTFTDDAGNTESLTSAATAAVTPPPLTASARRAPASHDGSSTFTFELHFSEGFGISYVTMRDHAFTVTGGELIRARRLTQGSNLGWEVTVEPSGSGSVTVVLPVPTDCAAQGAVCTDDGRKLSSEFRLVVPGPSTDDTRQDTPDTSDAGLPTVSGGAQVGETLTVSTVNITDTDGLTNVSYSYQWIRVSDAETDISAATGATYTLTADDLGKTVKVKVSFTDDAGNAESRTSAATDTVVAQNSSATGAPTISGLAQYRRKLTVSTSEVADANGLTGVSYSYQWISYDPDTQRDREISGANRSTYRLTDVRLIGKAVKVRVSFTDDAGHSESLTSSLTAEGQRRPADSARQLGVPIGRLGRDKARMGPAKGHWRIRHHRLQGAVEAVFRQLGHSLGRIRGQRWPGCVPSHGCGPYQRHRVHLPRNCRQRPRRQPPFQ